MGGGDEGESTMILPNVADMARRNAQLEAALVNLIDAVDANDREAIERALFVGRGLTF